MGGGKREYHLNIILLSGKNLNLGMKGDNVSKIGDLALLSETGHYNFLIT